MADSLTYSEASGDKKKRIRDCFFYGYVFFIKIILKMGFSPNSNGFWVFYGFQGLHNDYGGEKSQKTAKNH